MKEFFVYFRLQLKRVARVFPAILLTVLLLCGCLGLAAGAALEKNDSKESNMKVQIGLVGNIDSYMGVDLTGIIRLLSDRFGIEFIPMTEEEARKQLHDRKISTYAIIPDGIVDSIAYGDNDKKIVYVGAEGQRSISSIVMDEVADALSALITTSQAAIYGMQDYLLDTGQKKEIREATKEMNLAYIMILAEIYQMCDLETTGLDHSVSTMGYYLCSILIIFVLLCGISSAPLFTKKNMELPKLLKIRGQTVERQIGAEFLANLLLLFFCFALAGLLVGIVLKTGVVKMPEWPEFEAGTYVRFLLGLLPTLLTLCAMQFMIYEWVTNMIGSILLQFLVTVGMGYLSGCFYPLYFFPEGVQRLGGVLPVGAALKYANAGIRGETDGWNLLLLLGYLALFLLLTFFIRKRRVAAWNE